MRIWKCKSKKCAGVLFLMTLLAVGMLCITIYAMKWNSFENRVIRAIDRQCKEEGECIVLLSEATDFQWDMASIFVCGGDWVKVERALGIRNQSIELSDGIVFSNGGEVVEIHTSAYLAFRDMHPRLAYDIEREPGDPYYISYSSDNAFLRAQKIKREGWGYRYLLTGGR